MKKSVLVMFAAAAVVCLTSGLASAGVIDITLGTKQFNDGDIVLPIPFDAASGGDPIPFQAFQGSDPSPGPNFFATWSFNYLIAPLDVLLSASIEFGILDHDSAHAGSQLASFDVDGNNLTSSLDTLFETAGDGANNQYDVYFLALPASAFTDLADGTATFSLSLQGPTPGLLGNLPNNGAGLDFAQLRIETTSSGEVPEPSTALVFLLGMAALVVRSRSRRN